MLLESTERVRFIERSSLSKGHHWEVRTALAAVGYIRKNRETLRYEYFSGLQNSSHPDFEGPSLQNVCDRVIESLA